MIQAQVIVISKNMPECNPDGNTVVDSCMVVTYTAVHMVSHKTPPTYQHSGIEKQEEITKKPQTSKPLTF